MLIRKIAVAQPSWRVGAAEIAEWTGLMEAFVADKIGVKERAFLGAGETGLDLAAAAAGKILDAPDGVKRDDVDLLVVVTQNPDRKLPQMSSLLQHRLGLPVSAAGFDIALGCSGFVYALSTVKGFLAAEGLRNALIVTCDPYSRIMAKGDRNTVCLFGDAAAATWVSLAGEGRARLGRGDFGTDGSGAGAVTVAAGGVAEPLPGVLTAENAGLPDPAGLRLSMDGRAILTFMLERVPASIDRCLARNGLKRDDVDLFVFHQASAFMLETLRKALDLSPEKVPCRVDGFGNTVSSSIPIVLEDLLARGALEGRTVVVSGFGVGLSWATNVLHF